MRLSCGRAVTTTTVTGTRKSWMVWRQRYSFNMTKLRRGRGAAVGQWLFVSSPSPRTRVLAFEPRLSVHPCVGLWHSQEPPSGLLTCEGLSVGPLVRLSIWACVEKKILEKKRTRMWCLGRDRGPGWWDHGKLGPPHR